MQKGQIFYIISDHSQLYAVELTSITERGNGVSQIETKIVSDNKNDELIIFDHETYHKSLHISKNRPFVNHHHFVYGSVFETQEDAIESMLKRIDEEIERKEKNLRELKNKREGYKNLSVKIV